MEPISREFRPCLHHSVQRFICQVLLLTQLNSRISANVKKVSILIAPHVCASSVLCMVQVAAQRGEYGQERYEKLEFQKRVASYYQELQDSTWQVRPDAFPSPRVCSLCCFSRVQ